MNITRDEEREYILHIDLTDELCEYRRRDVDRMIEFLRDYACSALGRVQVESALRSLARKSRRGEAQ